MSFGLGETGRPQYDSDKLLDVRRKARADFQAFDKLMKRRRGKPPRPGDELPPRDA